MVILKVDLPYLNEADSTDARWRKDKLSPEDSAKIIDLQKKILLLF